MIDVRIHGTTGARVGVGHQAAVAWITAEDDELEACVTLFLTTKQAREIVTDLREWLADGTGETATGGNGEGER